jgi:hypothetical protein
MKRTSKKTSQGGAEREAAHGVPQWLVTVLHPEQFETPARADSPA